jgi:hypothetical protein
MLQLDEQGLGGVTPSSFSRFMGNHSLAQAISAYTQPDLRLPMSPMVQLDPLIVWVAGVPEQYSRSMDYAESLGIKVVFFFSLPAAKFWLELNDSESHQHHTM